MSKCTYLLTAEGADGALCVFSAPKACLTKPGDFVRYAGELFEVKSVFHVDMQSDAYKLICQLTDVPEADATFTRHWVKGAGYSG